MLDEGLTTPVTKGREGPEVMDLNNLISLLNLYLSEFIHRNQILWSQLYKLFFAILVVIVLPNIPELFKVSMAIPTIMFRVLGVALPLAFFYVGMAYCKKLKAITNTYNEALKKLPEGYRRESDKSPFTFVRTTYLVSVLMSFALLAVNGILWFYGQ
jgi:hypothetical protein